MNARSGWTGNLWANRFYSSVLGTDYLGRAARYIKLNPVRAKLARAAGEWPWSSARAHLGGRKPAAPNVTDLTDDMFA